MDVGTIIADKWKLGELLGEGGMGSVYAAVHVRNGRRAAIKFLHPETAPDVRARFFAEGFAANQVDHPGTVQVLDDGAEGDQPFLVMELLEGRSLQALTEASEGVLQVDTIAPYIAQVLEVLAVAHAKGIVHRDIKPENVFITAQGRAKLLDFGIARVDVPRDQKLTITGVMMGTPAFMAPEQSLAVWDEVDARSDVFAVGASLWICLTGTLLFEARTPAELTVFMSTKQVRPILEVAPDLPGPFAAIIDRALSFDRMKRFADASEMLAAWNDACAQTGLSAKLDPWSAARDGSPMRRPFEEESSVDVRRPAPSQPSHPTMSGVTTGHGRRAEPSRAALWVAGAAVLLAAAGGLYAYRATSASDESSAKRSAETTPGGAAARQEDVVRPAPSPTPSIEPLASASAVASAPAPTTSASSASASSAPATTVSAPSGVKPLRTSQTPTPASTLAPTAPKPTATTNDPFRF